MKKLLLIILTILAINTIAQNSLQRITAINEVFYTKHDTTWKEIDTTGNFVRVLEISNSNDIIKLMMSNNTDVEKYTYFIDKISTINGSTIYFARDYENFPIIVELSGNTLALYYFYDQESNSFEKAEKLSIQSNEKINIE